MKTTYMVKNVFCDGKVRIAEFGDNHLLLLTYLQKFTTFQGKIYFYFDTAFLELGITKFPLQKQLYQCLYDLKKWGLINITNNVDFNKIDRNTLITLDKVNYDRNYTLLLADEIDKILIAKEDIRVRKTMLYLYTIIEHRKYDKDFCYARRKTFKDDMQIKSNARVQNGLNKLKKYELIDFDNAGVVKDQKGRIFQANNIYVTTYTEGYEDILANAIQGNGEYHTENNSLVMPKKEKATRNEIPVANVDKSSISHNNININAENNQIEFDEKILNYEYERDYAQLLVKHVYIGMKENPILDSTYRQYEKLVDAYHDEIEYKKRVEKFQKHQATLKEGRKKKNVIEFQSEKIEEEEDPFLKMLEEEQQDPNWRENIRKSGNETLEHLKKYRFSIFST